MLIRVLQLIVFASAAVIVSGLASADVITLKSGQTHTGTITAEEEERIQIKLEKSGVRLWFLRDQILSFEKTEPEEDSEEGMAQSDEESPVALADDVVRAQEMLEKMREQAKNPQYKKRKSRTSFPKPPPEPKPQAGATPTASAEDIDALINTLRNDKNIYARLNAAKTLGKVGATEAIPDLIHALDDKTPLIRKAANNSLIKITGQDFGYDSNAQRSVRLWAIDKWEDWYDEVKKKEAKEQLKSWF